MWFYGRAFSSFFRFSLVLSLRLTWKYIINNYNDIHHLRRPIVIKKRVRAHVRAPGKMQATVFMPVSTFEHGGSLSDTRTYGENEILFLGFFLWRRFNQNSFKEKTQCCFHLDSIWSRS